MSVKKLDLAHSEGSSTGSPLSCGCPAGRPWPGATRPLVALPDVIFVPCRPRKAACNAIGSCGRRPITTLTRTLQSRRRRLIMPHLGLGGAIDRSRTAPPRGVPVDCASSNNTRERDATRRRESAFAVPGREGMMMVESERELSRAPQFRTRVDADSNTKSNRAERATDSRSVPGRHDPLELQNSVAWRRAGGALITSAPRLRNEPRPCRGPPGASNSSFTLVTY